MQNIKDLLDVIIMTLVKETGSDIHLIVDSSPTLRIGGELIEITKLPKLTSQDTDSIIKCLVDENSYLKLTENQQLDFAYSHREEYRLRGNAFFQKGSLSITLRLIPKTKTLKELNIPEFLYEFTKRRQGFFLVVGPVGQGKSATLASMIEYINNHDRKIILTIEDPVEYVYKNNKSFITQREIGFDASNFNTALNAAFRQDIDVLLVGEMRDTETIRAAVTAAETGHLVFSTLHTNSASQTIDRIIDSFPSGQQDQIRSQLASSLSGIFSQRLIPRNGGGLIPAFELLIVTSAVQNLIREKRNFELDTVIDTNGDKGMISFDRSLADLVRRGEIPLDAALKYSKNPRMFEQLI